MQIITKFREGKSPRATEYPHVVLTQDNWDDYGYKATFHAVLHLSPTESIDLESVKILSREQDGGYTQMPRQAVSELSVSHYSLGADLAYYEKLLKCGAKVYEPYLRGIRDVAFDDEIKAQVEDLEGYRVSLLRFSGAERTIADAAKLFKRPDSLPTKRKSAGFKVTFKTRVASEANSIALTLDFRKRRTLPSRVNALIGYNGTGKTKLLSNLAIVASGYGYADKQDILSDAAGRFIGTPPPFKKVVVVSYSAFDTFVIPGRTDVEKARLAEEGEIFGYAYCGLRERSDSGGSGAPSYRLKTPAEIEADFLQALSSVRKADRVDALIEVLRPLLRDPSFQRVGLSPLLGGFSDEDVTPVFRGMSSGHKVVLKIVTELTAHIAGAEPSLVLIDEPETHLHPPLLASLLKSVRVCLEMFDGFAVIATHSPVVLQETAARFVHILRRFGDESKLVTAPLETFGENIGVLTQEVFNLDDGTTDWHDTLRELALKHDLPEIEELFGKPLGFAARSYVLNVRNDEL